MKNRYDFSRAFQVGLPERLRRAYGRVNRLLHLRKWFPHVPLALATALFGLLQISPDVPRALGVPFFNAAARPHGELVHSALRGIPATVAGVFLIVMSAGLLLRSKLAWVTAVVIVAASAVLALANFAAASGFMLGSSLVLLAALFAASGSFYRSSLTAGTLFAVTSTLAVLVYAVFGSYQLGPDFRPPITDFTTALYYSVVTMSTVGYGDIVPVTAGAKLFVVSVIVLGISVFAASLSAVLVPVINRRIARLLRPGEGRMERSGHYVIIGDTALARNTYQALREREQHVTFVHASAEARVEEEADLVVGDPSDLDVLREAGADRAKAVLALSDDDSINAFVVLAMRELAEDVKTVAAVSRSRNLASLKRVHPDLIIAPQILGGEMLAMALSGEQLDSQDLFDRLLHFRS